MRSSPGRGTSSPCTTAAPCTQTDPSSTPATREESRYHSPSARARSIVFICLLETGVLRKTFSNKIIGHGQIYLCVQVIKGWDQGLLAMCVGEKRKLVIPPDLGYGDSGAGDKIPGGAVLVFEVELVDIQRKNEL